MRAFNYILVFLLIVVSSAGCFAADTVKESWWLTLDLEPRTTELNGLPIGEFNSNWQYAQYLDNADIKNKISAKDFEQFEQSSFSFTKAVDLNNNGVDEIFRVGVYKDKDEHQGIFLAILEKGKLVKVLSDSTKQNFSALLLDNGQLYWYRCMQCGDYEKLVSSGSSYFLE